MLSAFVLQQDPNVSSREKLAVEMSSSQKPGRLALHDISSDHPLVQREVAPVGSVEFVRIYAAAAGVRLPDEMSYPTQLRAHLGRDIYVTTFERAPAGCFVKPCGSIKRFTGGIKGLLDEAPPPDALVWVSAPVTFVAEWRVYVNRGDSVGTARYDSNEREYPFDSDTVQRMIAEFEGAPSGYGLDVGLTDTGQTLLVEVNDGWALGFYVWGSCSDREYAQLLADRWQELASVPTPAPAQHSIRDPEVTCHGR